MAQAVSYGSITIVDTTDIERIYVEYCRSTSNQLNTSVTPPVVPNITVNWSENTPSWVDGQYIWQRSVVKKSGSNDLSYGTPVCLTGAKGGTGEPGQSLTATKTQYTNVASNVTITKNNHTSYTWTDSTPEYDATKPTYWGRITNTYTNPAKTEYLFYKDQALTDAIYNAYVANSIATHAQEDAEGALSQAAAAQQLATQVDTLLGGHFIFGSALTSYTPAGARVVEQIKDSGIDVSSTPSKWHHNVIIGANGINLRYNEAVMAQLAANQSDGNTALIFYQPPTISGTTTVQGNPTMVLSGNALTFYNPVSGASAATLSSTGLNIVDGSITLGSTFSVNRNGELTATAGSIGGWTIDSNSIHSSNKNVWDKDVDGIFIGNHTVEEELIFTISGGKIQYVEADETEVNPETTYYVLDGDTYIKVIDIEPTDNPRHKGWYKDLGPMWYINSDGSASFGSLLVNQTGSLNVPAASISGLLTANQIEVDTLWVGNTTIGATIDSDFTSNTIEANSKLVMLSTTDTRAIDGKDYYGTIYSYEEVNSDGYYQLTEDEEVVEGKNYYSKNSDGTYSRVSSPAGDPSLQGWYELVSPSKETYYEKILVNELEDYYPERSFLAKGDNAASGSIVITNFPSNEILISYRFLNNETIREHTFHYGYPETFSDSMSQVVVNIIYDGSKEFTIEGNLAGGAIINAEYETYILSNDIIANIEKTYYMLKEETSIITGAIVSPYASGYEEKIKQSYISLKTEKVDYILTKDSLVKENKSYYYYNYEYVFTKDTEVNKESIYYKTIKIKTDDVEPNDNKTYYYKNNSNNYIAIDWINNSSLYVLTEDTTIVAGKNYYIKNANDEYIIVSNPTGNPKEQNWYEYLDTLYEDKMQIVTPLELIGDNINPFENGWLEKVASYILVNNPSGNPQTNDYYEVQSIASAELVLENGNIFIKSNENTILSTDSSEGDINITSADILGDIGFGNILLMPFENGFIVQTKE